MTTSSRREVLADLPVVLREEFRHPTVADPPPDLAEVDDPKALYVRSYELSRAVVGVIGLVLPFVFIVVEWFFLAGEVRVRGSISAYFHTGARDVFVGGLCVIAFMLTTYLAGQFRRPDYWLSSIAGVALLFVVFFPTGRPGVETDGPFCGDAPEPPGCVALQQALGEKTVATVHFVAAVVFILGLAVISWYWARREDAYARPHDSTARDHDSARSGWGRLQRACAVAIVVAVVWVVVGGALGLQIWQLTPLYVGEVLAVWAFAVAWLARSRDWWQAALRGPVLPAHRSRVETDPT